MLPNSANSENQRTKPLSADEFLNSISAAFPPHRWIGHKVVVGVSGGPDSLALAHGLELLRNSQGSSPPGNLILAHCNYQLRGEESEKDELHVRHLAQELKSELVVWKAPIPSQPGGVGPESHLREIRYRFLTGVAKDSGARYLTVGHTRDDQAETIMMRLLRGTSWEGLRGIPAWRQIDEHLTLIRPLLKLSRTAVLAFLSEKGIEFRLDSSNNSKTYYRNQVRNDLLPYLETHFAPDFRSRLLNLSSDAEEVQSCFESLLGGIESALELAPPHAMLVNPLALRQTHKALIKQLVRRAWSRLAWPLRDMTSKHWAAIANMIQPQPKPLDASTDVTFLQSQLLNPWAESEPPHTKDFDLPGNISIRRKADGTIELRRN